MSKALLLLVLLSNILFSISTTEAATDPRFFGRYCGTYTERVQIRAPIFGFVLRTERVDVSIDARADYENTPSGNTLVIGEGLARVRRETVPFVFSGTVVQRGRLSGTGWAPGYDSVSATARLAADGETLTFRGFGRTITLSKAACGNERPTARIVGPTTSGFLWGEPITFLGRATDTEDGTIPESRLVWTSDRDGTLGVGNRLDRNLLRPGRHVITLTALDSGGRIAEDRITITIADNPPYQPRLMEPTNLAAFYAGQLVTFRGRAQDRETGDIVGDALVWTSDRDGWLGTGETFRRALSEGTHQITLTASDGVRTSEASVTVTVRPRPAGNTPPTVAILAPRGFFTMADFECVTLVGAADDLEDGSLGGASLRWEARYFDGTRTRERVLGRGERVEYCNPSAPSGDTLHHVTLHATDSEGVDSPAPDEIKLYVIPGGLI